MNTLQALVLTQVELTDGGVEMRKIIPQIGERYGRMEIVGLLPDKITKSGNTETQVLCQCECGTIKPALYRALRQGSTTSCGCYMREATSLKNREYNKYYIDDDVTKMYDNRGNYTLIDTEDIERLKPYYFIKDANGYWSTCHKNIKLHRFLMDAPEGMVVDHISHDRSDNRKCNLRVCTVGQNNLNNRRKGYYYNKADRKWMVICYRDGKRYYGGRYNTEEEAKEASKKLRNKIFGEFAYKGE